MPESSSITESPDFQHLLSMGFTEVEAARLLHMRDHATEEVEYREMVQQSRRLDFIRWLVEHDRMGS